MFSHRKIHKVSDLTQKSGEKQRAGERGDCLNVNPLPYQQATAAATFLSQKDKEMVFAQLFRNPSAPTTPSSSPFYKSLVRTPPQ